MSRTYVEHHYGDYRDSEKSNSLRACGATIGGAARCLCLNQIRTTQERKIQKYAPVFRRLWEMGGYVPMIVDALVFDKAQITSKLNYSHPTWGGDAIPSQAQPDKR